MKKPLPCDICKGRCCRYAPIELHVWEKVKNLVPSDTEIIHRWVGTPREAFIANKPNTDGECVFLTAEGRCGIYSRRPRSCRAVGRKFPCGFVDPAGADEMVTKALASGHEFTDPKMKVYLAYKYWQGSKSDPLLF